MAFTEAKALRQSSFALPVERHYTYYTYTYDVMAVRCYYHFFPSLRCHIRNELEHKYHIVFEWISESKCFSEMLSWVEMERANKRVLRFASERAGKQHASIKYVSDCVQMRIAFRWRSEITREKTHTDRSMHTHTRHITFCWDTTRRKHNINKNTRCEWF